MVPPGLAMVNVSPLAWEAHKKAAMPRFYLDFTRAKSYLDRGQTPWTPAVSMMYGLDLALEKMLAEGMEAVFQRHHETATLIRRGVKTLGLKLFAEEKVASNTVTAIHVPDGVDAGKLLNIIRLDHEVVLAGGQSSLDGKIFRIGHLGHVTHDDITEVFDSLREVLPRVGFPVASIGVK